MSDTPAGGVVRRIDPDGPVTVERVDETAQAESAEPSVPYPTDKNYRAVELLANGWIRCLGPAAADGPVDDDGPADGRGAVDYYPPRLVNGIFTVEQREDAEAERRDA